MAPARRSSNAQQRPAGRQEPRYTARRWSRPSAPSTSGLFKQSYPFFSLAVCECIPRRCPPGVSAWCVKQVLTGAQARLARDHRVGGGSGSPDLPLVGRPSRPARPAPPQPAGGPAGRPFKSLCWCTAGSRARLGPAGEAGPRALKRTRLCSRGTALQTRPGPHSDPRANGLGATLLNP